MAFRRVHGSQSEDEWIRLRERVIDGDYMTCDDLARKKRFAGLMKHAVWLCPVALAVVVVEAISGSGGILVVVGGLLVAYGALRAFLLGRVWEQRWKTLLDEKRSIVGHQR